MNGLTKMINNQLATIAYWLELRIGAIDGVDTI